MRNESLPHHPFGIRVVLSLFMSIDVYAYGYFYSVSHLSVKAA